MGKNFTQDNTYSLIIICITLLLAFGIYKIFSMVIKLNDKIEDITLKDKIEDPGPSGISLEEKIQDHIDSLKEEELIQIVEEDEEE